MRFRRNVTDDGVEISNELASIARENVTKSAGWLKCSKIEIVTCDATLFQLPPATSIIYFYNPFYGRVLESVLLNIRQFAGTLTRPLLITDWKGNLAAKITTRPIPAPMSTNTCSAGLIWSAWMIAWNVE